MTDFLGGMEMAFQEYKAVKDSRPAKVGAEALLKAMLWTFGLLAGVFVLAALLLTYTPMPEHLIPFIVIVASLLSVAVGGMMAARVVKSRGWLRGILVGILYSLILFLLSSVTFGAKMSSYFLIMTLLHLLAGAAGGIFGINMSDKRKR